jgi:hypothetical protein
MVTGKHLQLTADILGTHAVDKVHTAEMIPQGVTVQVVSGLLADNRTVVVAWEGRMLAVFAEDLFERSIEVQTVIDGRTTRLKPRMDDTVMP